MSDTLELAVLRRCVRRSQFLAKAKRKLDGFRFANWVRDWAWRTTLEVYEETNEAIGFRVLAERAIRALKEDELPEVLKELRRIRDAEPLESPNSALGELAEQFQIQRGTVIADELVTAIENKDTEAIRKAIADGGEAVRKRDREGDTGILEVAREILTTPQDDPSSVFIPTGFNYIDRRWRGIKVGEVCLYFGVTSAGKSAAMISSLVKCATRGNQSLLITTEMTKREQASRVMSRCTGVLEQHIRENELTRGEKKLLARWIAANWERLNRLIRIEHFKPGECSIADVKDLLTDMRRRGQTPKAVFIDSPDQIHGRGRFKDKRDDETWMYYEIQALAEEFGFAAVMSTQAKQIYANKICTAEAMGENYQKSRAVQWLMSINPIKGDDGEIRNFLYIAKRRHGQRYILIPLVCDYERMRMDTSAEHGDGDTSDEA